MLVGLLVRTIAIAITAYLVPGVVITDWVAAVVAVVVLGILNTVVRPLLLILTIPVNIMTLGLFTLVINTAMILLATQIVPGFKVDSFLTAFIFSLVLSLVSWFLESLAKK